MNLKGSDNYAALSDLIIYYASKNSQKSNTKIWL